MALAAVFRGLSNEIHELNRVRTRRRGAPLAALWSVSILLLDETKGTKLVVDRRGAGGRPPDRRLGVMFLGAGASKAAGLPLTEELLRHIWPRDYELSHESWASQKSARQWKADLEGAVKVLYPDGGSQGFRPPVSEFFTLLEVMDRVHAGRERLPLDAGDLLKSLRAEIARGLSRAVESKRRRSAQLPHHRWFTAPQGRPSVIVTSNWDTLAEQTALRAGLNVQLSWPRNANGDRRADLPPRRSSF